MLTIGNISNTQKKKRIYSGGVGRYWTTLNTGGGTAHNNELIKTSSNGSLVVVSSQNSLPGTYHIWVSTDSGNSWSEKLNIGAVSGKNSRPTKIDMSSNGNKIAFSVTTSGSGAAATNDYIYLSTDYGNTWNQQINSGLKLWSGVCMSSNGDVVGACSNTASALFADQTDYIYISVDGGTNWSQKTSAGKRSWRNIDCSSDGTIFFAYVYNEYIYVSTDSGNTWSQKTSTGTNFWTSLSCSDDGTKILATANNTAAYLSTNSGADWNIIFTAQSGNQVIGELSPNGKNIFLSVKESSTGPIRFYNSFNNGETWNETQYSADFTDYYKTISSVGDGSKIYSLQSKTSDTNIKVSNYI